MVNAHNVFLEGLGEGYVFESARAEEWEQTDNEQKRSKELVESSGSVSASEAYDVKRLRTDVQSGRDLLSTFGQKARGVTPDKDPKLLALSDQLLAILKQANEEGLSQKEIRDKRKVLIFSYFADTVSWIYRYLFDLLANDKRFASY